jgi:hypothetical protein
MITSYREIEIIETESWPLLCKQLLVFHNRGFSFRGLKNSSWPLNSSLERSFPLFTQEQQRDYYINACKYMRPTGLFKELNIDSPENIIYEYFKGEENYNNSRKNSNLNKVEKVKAINANIEHMISIHPKMYSIMLTLQHYNIPTHFIDITASIQIAAYFALFYSIDACPNEKAKFPAIFAIIKHWDDEFYWLVRSKVNKPLVPKFIHERQWSQEAWFIDSLSSDKYDIFKFIIDPKWIPEIFSELSLKNITGFSLFKTIEMAGVDYFYKVKLSI